MGEDHETDPIASHACRAPRVSCLGDVTISNADVHDRGSSHPFTVRHLEPAI